MKKLTLGLIALSALLIGCGEKVSETSAPGTSSAVDANQFQDVATKKAKFQPSGANSTPGAGRTGGAPPALPSAGR